MIEDAKTFFAWFQGYTEDIEGAPSERQWGRIKGQIEQLGNVLVQAQHPLVPAAALMGGTTIVANAVEQPAPKPKPKPTNEAEWLAQYKDALMEMGVDEESADEFTGEYNDDNPPDIRRDPAAEAEINVGPMLHN